MPRQASASLVFGRSRAERGRGAARCEAEAAARQHGGPLGLGGRPVQVFLVLAAGGCGRWLAGCPRRTPRPCRPCRRSRPAPARPAWWRDDAAATANAERVLRGCGRCAPARRRAAPPPRPSRTMSSRSRCPRVRGALSHAGLLVALGVYTAVGGLVSILRPVQLPRHAARRAPGEPCSIRLAARGRARGKEDFVNAKPTPTCNTLHSFLPFPYFARGPSRRAHRLWEAGRPAKVHKASRLASRSAMAVERTVDMWGQSQSKQCGPGPGRGAERGGG